MIWFACKCGKVHGRADGSAGAMVFCDCGIGMRVPWESTAAAPPIDSTPSKPKKTLEPIHFDHASSPPPVPISTRRERRRRTEPIDPNVCFNHPSADKSIACADCGLSFCTRCATTFQRATYCSACKNYRTRMLQRRPDGSKLAVVSFLSALAAGPAMLLLTPLAASWPGRSYLFLALIPVAFAILAGAVSLRWIERDPHRGGSQLAYSGIGLGVVVGIFTVLLAFFGQKIMA